MLTSVVEDAKHCSQIAIERNRMSKRAQERKIREEEHRMEEIQQQKRSEAGEESQKSIGGLTAEVSISC